MMYYVAWYHSILFCIHPPRFQAMGKDFTYSMPSLIGWDFTQAHKKAPKRNNHCAANRGSTSIKLSYCQYSKSHFGDKTPSQCDLYAYIILFNCDIKAGWHIYASSNLAFTGSPTIHHLYQCWLVISWSLANIFPWNLTKYKFIWGKLEENIVCKMAAPLSRPQCVKLTSCPSVNEAIIKNIDKYFIWMC